MIAGSLPFTIGDVRRELKGKDLVCWCKPGAPCQADVLLGVAKGEGWSLKLPNDGTFTALYSETPEGGRLTVHGYSSYLASGVA